MKRFFIIAAVMLFLLTPLARAAGTAGDFGDFRIARIDDPLRSTFVGDPARLGKQVIQQAISAGALAKDWRVVREMEGRTELTTTVRGKHLAHVMVLYDDSRFEIQYLDSANLHYSEKREGNRTLRGIHKNYNVWIHELAAAINGKVGEPATVATAKQAFGPVTKVVPKAKIAHAYAVPPDSGFAAVTDVDAVPLLRAAGKDRYKHYLTLSSPKAFTVTDKGGWRIWTKSEDVLARALDFCEQAVVGCWLYAVDDKVVWSADPAKRYSRFDQLQKRAP